MGGGAEIVAIENDKYIASIYKQMYPDDEVVVADAHQYLLDHFQEFDFIWSSPPCPSHSRLSTASAGWGIYRYPDMTLWQEIIFLKHFYKGKWLVENVIPYYKTALHPTMILDRHYFWSNFHIPRATGFRQYDGEISNATENELAEGLGITLPPGTKGRRKLLRNAVDPKVGLHIFKAMQVEVEQGALL